MPLINDDELERIDLPTPGEWVDVKAKWSQGDDNAIKKAVYAGATIHGENNVTFDAPAVLEAAEFAVFERAIKAWSYPDPVTPENIRRMDTESAEFLKERLNVLYARRTDDEKKVSASNGATSSVGRAGHQAP